VRATASKLSALPSSGGWHMSDRAPRYAITPRLLALTYIVMASLASLGLPRLASTTQVSIAVGLMLMIALVFACTPNTETPRWKTRAYFALQTVLIGSLLVLAPEGRRIFAVLFLMTSGQATVFLLRATGFVWVGIFVLVLSARKVWVEGQCIEELSPLEFNLIVFLYRKVGQVCTHDQLLAHLYPDEVETGVEDARLVTLVRRVRQAIEPDRHRPRYLLTVRGTGYKLLDIPQLNQVVTTVHAA